jgi:heme exporter protein CcmD
MSVQEIKAFLDMGGSGLYVWSSYAMTVFIMLAEPLLIERRRRRALMHVGPDQGMM